MFVAATTKCFSELPLDSALQRLVDLEFSNVEIMIHEEERHLKPSEVFADLERSVQICRQTRRLTPVAYSVHVNAPEPLYYQHFGACCKLAKATKVVNVVVQSSELGTPFNAEVERLAELVRIASDEGVVVGLLTQRGRMTEDPDTAAVLCDSVKGLAITLDPSHFVLDCDRPTNFDRLLSYVCHVRLRDTTKEALQVRVGQGQIEYGRLVTHLTKHRYTRALSIDMGPLSDVDHNAEMRKMRLLLESLM